MAMTQEERNMVEKLQRTVDAIQRGEDITFIENMRRRLDIPAIIRNLRLGDFFNVEDDAITDGQILKYDASVDKYLPANDNTA